MVEHLTFNQRVAGSSPARLTIISLVLILESLAAFAQECNVIGTVEKLARGEISVKTPRGSFAISAGQRTEVIKDKPSRGFASLKAGDEVSVHCEADSSGKFVAVKVWASVVSFSATIKNVRGDDLEIVAKPDSGSPREEHKIVHLYPDTALGTSRTYLVAGQDVRVVGFEVGNGAVDGARIAVYNTDLPVTK